MRTRLLAVAALLALVLTGCGAYVAPDGGSASTESPTPSESPSTSPAPSLVVDEIFTPVTARVLAPPVATPTTDGRVHLAYELLLSNILSQSVGLDAVTVTGDGEELLTLTGAALAPWMKVYGATEPTREIGPGQQALVWLDVVVDTLDDVPSTLQHEVTISPEEAVEPLFSTPVTETVALISPLPQAPIVISSPLRGDNWLDGNSCCTVTPHRGAVNAINGGLWAPERFAIDFARLDDQNRVFSGPIDELSSYAYFGADIHAVADGPVVAIVSDLPEQKPGANPSGLTVEEYGGNHIVQDIGGGHYAFYAHLQPDNPEGLQVGDQLTRGQVIGLLGNTGNSDSPHLHFHVMDSPLPLASNGLPFLFDDFDLVGQIPSEDDLIACITASESCAVEEDGAGARTAVSPLYLDVMDLR